MNKGFVWFRVVSWVATWLSPVWLNFHGKVMLVGNVRWMGYATRLMSVRVHVHSSSVFCVIALCLNQVVWMRRFDCQFDGSVIAVLMLALEKHFCNVDLFILCGSFRLCNLNWMMWTCFFLILISDCSCCIASLSDIRITILATFRVTLPNLVSHD